MNSGPPIFPFFGECNEFIKLWLALLDLRKEPRKEHVKELGLVVQLWFIVSLWEEFEFIPLYLNRTKSYGNRMCVADSCMECAHYDEQLSLEN